MTEKITTCPIWGDKYDADGYFDEATRTFHVDNSPRAGGGYVISQVELNASIQRFDESAKARLTTWLIDQHLQGNKGPVITEDVAKHVSNKVSLPVWDRQERLLKYLANSSNLVSQRITIEPDNPMVFAWSESVSWNDVVYLVKYLLEEGYLEGQTLSGGSFRGNITVSGFSKIAEANASVAHPQAFVAMWFDPRTNDAYDKGVAPAIEEAGFNPLRIDRKLDVEKIDDSIIAEIRRSKFLVADFTHGEKGARGGVYFEAGFAMGLDIPVFFTCHGDTVEDLHFDTRQYAHIVWSTPEDLRFALRDRILARIGSGPNRDERTPLVERPVRKPLGQWLVDNLPRGANLEPPARDDYGRPNPFLEEDGR